MLLFLQVPALPGLLRSARVTTTPKECEDKAAACLKANSCAENQHSKECKACRASYDKCVAELPEMRRAKKTTKR